MISLIGSGSLATQFFQIGAVRRIDRWLHTTPQPSVVVEIADDHVAAAQQGSGHGKLDAFAVEPLPTGSVMASPLETNVTQPDTVRSALRRVFHSVPAHGESVALLVPDPVVRVFILPFDTLPRRAEEALPLLRWRLKKSVPFDMDETVVSWMRQNGREGNLEVVTAVARQQILREYEEIIESLGRPPRCGDEFHAGHVAAARGNWRHTAGAILRQDADLRHRPGAQSVRVPLDGNGRRCRPARPARPCSTRFFPQSRIIRTHGDLRSIAPGLPASARGRSFSAKRWPRS